MFVYKWKKIVDKYTPFGSFFRERKLNELKTAFIHSFMLKYINFYARHVYSGTNAVCFGISYNLEVI
jgi:hypothetical protein